VDNAADLLVIADEAGYAEKPGATARELLVQFEEAGAKIVRVYPGNVTPPSKYQVIEIGNDVVDPSPKKGANHDA